MQTGSGKNQVTSEETSVEETSTSAQGGETLVEGIETESDSDISSSSSSTSSISLNIDNEDIETESITEQVIPENTARNTSLINKRKKSLTDRSQNKKFKSYNFNVIE